MPDANEMSPLTDRDMERFRRLAPRVVRGRRRGYFLRELDSSIHFLVAGTIPIIGLAMLGWSAINWLILLVAGCWMGIICDCIRLCFLKKQIDLYCERIVDDTFVSVVSEALRAKKTEIHEAHRPSKPDYSMGLLVDLIFCTVSSVVIVGSLPEKLSSEVFDREWFLPSLIGFLAYRLLMTAWQVIDLRCDRGGEPVVKLALALRGAGMFIVMFIVLMVFDATEDSWAASRHVVFAINGIWIAIGLMNLYGLCLMISETRWLRKYLGEQSTDSTGR